MSISNEFISKTGYNFAGYERTDGDASGVAEFDFLEEGGERIRIVFRIVHSPSSTQGRI
jgi:hypothetical protein